MARNDEAKLLGPHWDREKKLWYFQYDLKEFCDNKNSHTLDSEPLYPTIINFNCDNEKWKTHRLINNVFEEVQSRWKTYIPPIE